MATFQSFWHGLISKGEDPALAARLEREHNDPNISHPDDLQPYPLTKGVPSHGRDD